MNEASPPTDVDPSGGKLLFHLNVRPPWEIVAYVDTDMVAPFEKV